jgi:hypothetical protein
LGAAIVSEEPLGSEWAPVTRLHLDSGASVVVKTRRTPEGVWNDAFLLDREADALRVVADLRIAPALIAADEAVLITTDERGPLLEDLLIRDGADAATEAFVALADALGRLHAATRRDTPNDPYGPWPGAHEWQRVIDATRDLDFPDAGAAQDDADWLCTQLREPRGLAVLNHGDPTPNNTIVTSQGARLVDWEGATYRHAGCDVATLHFPFPHYSAHWHTLPDDVVGAAHAAYTRHMPAFDDVALAVGCAAELCVRVQRLPKLALAEDSWRRRTQLLQQIDVFTPIADRAGVLGDMAGWFGQLAHAMRDRWSDAGNPPPSVFPAYCK